VVDQDRPLLGLVHRRLPSHGLGDPPAGLVAEDLRVGERPAEPPAVRAERLDVLEIGQRRLDLVDRWAAQGLAVDAVVADDVHVDVGEVGLDPACGRAAQHQSDDRRVRPRDQLVERRAGGGADHGPIIGRPWAGHARRR